MMKLNHFHIIRRSLSYNLKGIGYQFAIIVVLTAVITGSLLTGKSVRRSLKEKSAEKIGNTGILISSGIRYADPTLVGRIAGKTGTVCTGLLEIRGYCQNFITGQTAPGVTIFATGDDFFSFHGNENIKIEKGKVAVNEALAHYLEVKRGDDLIIRFGAISDIPADAPFAPEKDQATSIVLKIEKILGPSETGNFSLGISQIAPLNLFVNRSDLSDTRGKVPKINRLLLKENRNISVSETYRILTNILKPEDIGMMLRLIPATGGYELISDRIFIDGIQVEEITGVSPNSYPVLTYLANRVTYGNKSTPYSFISALDPSLYDGVPDSSRIVINSWLAEDLGVNIGDTIWISWYSPDKMNQLIEEKKDFIVDRITEMKGIWNDSLLMPRFPGISGRESCTDWDAGVAIKMDLIRDKDEKYWTQYQGTPKAFISYRNGLKLWGSNFGPATSIRFAGSLERNELDSMLTGKLDPYKSGFTITDLPDESIRAANESVDFSTLFLSLGFFIILSALILLVLLVSSFFDSRKQQVMTLFSLGFTFRNIEKLLLVESAIIALVGTVLGTFAGGIFNILIINALNSVWSGAVQTNTLASGLDPGSLVAGFASSFIIIIAILKIKSTRYLKELGKPETGEIKKASGRKNALMACLSFALTILLVALSFVLTDYSTQLSFSSGIIMLVSMIFAMRRFYIGKPVQGINSFSKVSRISGSYFSFNPSHAITPVLFLSAGLFAVVITGVNKLNISENMLLPSGGTGGYLLWGESSVPVRDNLSSRSGVLKYGFEDPELKEMSLIQAKKTSGNDASCLNLNHISSPPLLGIDPVAFMRKGSFSFAEKLKSLRKSDPWSALALADENNSVYGIADQTVLQYGLKIKVGDTLKIRSENGQILNVIIAAGLKSSLFQGYVIIGAGNFSKYFPSVAGSQIFLVDGNRSLTEVYKNILTERLSEFGVHFESAGEKLSSFFVVTNTYLSVFTLLGGIGMILGVAGLGFVLARNFHNRKRDFGLMMAAGFSLGTIRRMVFEEQAIILLAGIFTGLFSALIATRPSIMNNSDIPWTTILIMILLVAVTGFTALAISVSRITRETLISRIRKE